MFPEIHDETIANVLVAFMDAHNQSARDKSTGRIIESERKAFLDTVDRYTKFQLYRHRVATAGTSGRAGKHKRV